MRKPLHAHTMLALFAFVGLAGWQVRADTVSLMAATANPNTKPEVRLRWVTTDSWLAPGGYNLYRIVNGQRTKVNTQPITTKPGTLKPEMVTVLRRPVQVAGGLPQAGFFQKALPRDTTHVSREAFKAYGTVLKQQSALTAPQLWKLHQGKTPIIAVPQALQRYHTLMFRKGNGQLNPQPLPPGRKLTPEEETIRRRQQLQLAALVNPSLADALGMSYTDQNVQNGQQITYALRAIDDKGTESPNDVATVTITVGKDPQPPAPDVEAPIQTGVHSVAFHWTDPPENVMKTLVTGAYVVWRIDKAHPQGVKINDHPIMVSYQNANGSRTPSLITFTDDNAPIEPLTYKITLTDAFGRVSQPTTVQMAMEDWRTPSPVTGAQASLIAEGRITTPIGQIVVSLEKPVVVVLWNRSPNDAVGSPVYRIFRIDTEQPNAPPQLLTPQPIQGQPYGQDSAPPARVIELLAGAKLQKFHANLQNGQQKLAPKIMMQIGHAAPGQKGFVLSGHETWKELAATGVDTANIQSVAQKVVLTFTDTTIVPDHYYRYLVTADYPANLRDSTPAATNVVAVPLGVAPPGPANLKASFTKSAQTAEMQQRSRYLCDPRALGLEPPNFRINRTNANKRTAVPSTLLAIQSKRVVGLTTPHGSIINLQDFSDALPADIGGSVTLTWSAVNTTKGMRYRIYRASLTGYFPPNTQAAAPVGPPPPPGSQSITFKGGLAPLQRPLPLTKAQAQNRKTFLYVRSNSNILGANGQIIAKYVPIVSISAPLDWKLLGETDQTQFTDPMPRSRATYYAYRVEAVTRWGIASAQPTVIQFRVPSTLPPSTPVLQKVVANEEGKVTLAVVPNPPNEEVVKFLVYRQAVPSTVTVNLGTLKNLGEVFHHAGLVAPATSSSPSRPTTGSVAPAKPFITVKPFITTTPAASTPTTSAATHIQNLNVKLQQVHAASVFAGKNLIANDQKAQVAFAASSRFGVRQQQSPALALSQLFKGEVAEGGVSKIVNIDPTLLGFFDLKNYTQIGEVDVPSGTTEPVEFVDTSAEPEVTYEYTVVAVDQDDNRSFPAHPMDGSAFKVKADPPQNVSVSYDAAQRAARLSWTAPASGAGGYVVYRAIQPTNNALPNYIQLAVLPGNGGTPPTSFTDYNVRSGPTYLYIVRAIDKSGNISAPPQQPVSFKVP